MNQIDAARFFVVRALSPTYPAPFEGGVFVAASPQFLPQGIL